MRTTDRQKRRWLIEFGVVSPRADRRARPRRRPEPARQRSATARSTRAKQEAVVVSKLAIEPQLSADDLEPRAARREARAASTTRSARAQLGRRVVARVGAQPRPAGSSTRPTSRPSAAPRPRRFSRKARARGRRRIRGRSPTARAARSSPRSSRCASPATPSPPASPRSGPTTRPSQSTVAADSRSTARDPRRRPGRALGAALSRSRPSPRSRLRKQAADREQQALSDALTGLPNRTMFNDLVQRTILGAQRKKKLVVGDADGPRPLQGGQRHAWPPQRRPAAPAHRPAPPGRAARRRDDRPPRRRRVRDPDPRRARIARPACTSPSAC